MNATRFGIALLGCSMALTVMCLPPELVVDPNLGEGGAGGADDGCGNLTDCNGRPDDGCEANLLTDPTNCGTCDRNCPAINGDVSCFDGTCRIQCAEGFFDCNDDRGDGCEQSLTSDVDNCGTCFRKCPFDAGETPYCSNGVCGATVCPDGRGNCDGVGEDCERDLTSDVEHCGRCGRACVVASGTGRCDANRCVVGSCEVGWGNCNEGDADGGYADGCETNTNLSEDHCGVCGNSCQVENGTGSCVDGECRIGDCDQDWENCNTDAPRAGYDDGCESNLLTSRTNCGSCGTECLEIGGANACSTGMCVPECDATHGNCDGDPNDGCETAITGAGNEAHCGNCTTECTTAGATITTCSGSGLCIPSCDATHLSCDTGAPGGANGCESDVNAPSSCGRCGATCDGDTPNCVQTGDARTCQAGIVLANDVDGSTPSAVLNLTHALQSGSNRLILIAVAAEVGGGDPVPSRPDVVTYGGTAMTAGPEQSGGTNFWSPDLFVYYVTENELVGKSGSQAVVIDGSPGTGDPGAIIANLVQFNGVRQTTPLSATSGRILDGQTTPNPDTITSAVTVSTAGSRIYSFNAGTFTYSPSVAVTSSPMLTHMLGSTGIEVMSPVAMRVMGLYVGGGSPNSLAPGSYDVSWTYAAANELTHLAVVIHPAQGL